MGCDVFANGNEIACKASSNKTVADFPDVCLSPPSPPAGPIPVPYPNSSFAKDMKNGSKKVKIKKKPIMLKDKSFYKTSPIGDEAATKSFGSNVIIHGITGKTYFNAWSSDVKAEGANLCRFLDITTSNHSSKPGGTPTPSPSTGTGGSSPSTPCTDHVWGDITPDSEISYTADQKKDRLRKSKEKGAPFEADAADHNNVTEGNCLSGENEKSKLRLVCTVCGAKGNDVDHVERDSTGKVTKIVEVKSGNCNIKAKQFKTFREAADNMGATLQYKLEAGPGADKAADFLKSKGFDPANIIPI